MKNIIKQSGSKDASVNAGKQRSYNEIIEFLDSNWHTKAEPNLQTIKKLNQAFDLPSEKIPVISVTGSNGKTLTVNFATKLLRAEGLHVGAFSSPHFLTYNERFSINNETISNKVFTEIGNEVLNMAEALSVAPHTHEVLTMMALLYFTNNNVDVALFEPNELGMHDATNICSPKIIAITRVTSDKGLSKDIDAVIKNLLSPVKNNMHVVSADQSKLNLQVMHVITQEKGGVWAMPIRKLAPLAYPFEQLHGRCAALAERIAHLYMNEFIKKDSVIVSSTLLTKQKGQRGRPSLEAKRQSEMNPQKTLMQFWKEEHVVLPGHFQLLDKEKPSLLLDNANNLDAFKNLLLGVRLLHYQRPLKGLTLVLGCNNPHIDVNEFLKLLRYFFKKTSGQIMLCPVAPLPGHQPATLWDIEKIVHEIKGMKIKARACKDFKEAFETAQKSVDERHGIVIVTGSSAVIADYWNYKGVKKI